MIYSQKNTSRNVHYSPSRPQTRCTVGRMLDSHWQAVVPAKGWLHCCI